MQISESRDIRLLWADPCGNMPQSIAYAFRRSLPGHHMLLIPTFKASLPVGCRGHNYDFLQPERSCLITESAVVLRVSADE
jgi:hypothetical protein